MQVSLTLRKNPGLTRPMQVRCALTMPEARRAGRRETMTTQINRQRKLFKILCLLIFSLLHPPGCDLEIDFSVSS